MIFSVKKIDRLKRRGGIIKEEMTSGLSHKDVIETSKQLSRNHAKWREHIATNPEEVLNCDIPNRIKKSWVVGEVAFKK